MNSEDPELEDLKLSDLVAKALDQGIGTPARSWNKDKLPSDRVGPSVRSMYDMAAGNVARERKRQETSALEALKEAIRTYNPELYTKWSFLLDLAFEKESACGKVLSAFGKISEASSKRSLVCVGLPYIDFEIFPVAANALRRSDVYEIEPTIEKLGGAASYLADLFRQLGQSHSATYVTAVPRRGSSDERRLSRLIGEVHGEDQAEVSYASSNSGAKAFVLKDADGFQSVLADLPDYNIEYDHYGRILNDHSSAASALYFDIENNNIVDWLGQHPDPRGRPVIVDIGKSRKEGISLARKEIITRLVSSNKPLLALGNFWTVVRAFDETALVSNKRKHDPDHQLSVLGRVVSRRGPLRIPFISRDFTFIDESSGLVVASISILFEKSVLHVGTFELPVTISSGSRPDYAIVERRFDAHLASRLFKSKILAGKTAAECMKECVLAAAKDAFSRPTSI